MLALLAPLGGVGCGVPAAVSSALLDARTEVTARQISISFPLMGNGHLIGLLVIVLFLLWFHEHSSRTRYDFIRQAYINHPGFAAVKMISIYNL
ncbi:hypothetical protein C8B47_26955 [filamentous cyanobacterium CCP4]|nr:hypothetical protein C8B47_26955 [filamentous cyanobacterium CCP4]